MTNAYIARENPFPPEEESPAGTDTCGTEYYHGDKLVDLDGKIYTYDNLDVDTILKALDILPFIA